MYALLALIGDGVHGPDFAGAPPPSAGWGPADEFRWETTGARSARSAGLEDARDRLRAIVRIELSEQLLDVIVGGVDGDAHRVRHLVVGEALRHQQCDL